MCVDNVYCEYIYCLFHDNHMYCLFHDVTQEEGGAKAKSSEGLPLLKNGAFFVLYVC